MPISFGLINLLTGIVILILIVLANYYQFRIRRRFSGVIGKVMFWYSLGLAALLALTIFNWVTFSAGVDLPSVTAVDRIFDIAAIACFLKGAMVIR
jgi:hypothetical protein